MFANAFFDLIFCLFAFLVLGVVVLIYRLGMHYSSSPETRARERLTYAIRRAEETRLLLAEQEREIARLMKE